MDSGQRTFGSDDNFGEIEFSIPDELIEVVATDATHDFRKSPFDLVAMNAGYVRDPSLQASPALGFFKVHFAKRSAFSGREDNIHFQNVINRLAIDDGMRAGGIVPHHAAERCPIRGRGVRTE